MKNLTNQFVTYVDNEEFRQRMDAYGRIIKTKEWEFFKDVLITVRGEILGDMFSQKFTNLEPDDKNSLQKTYFQINQLLDFLSDPRGWVRKKTLKHKLYDQVSKVVKPNKKGDKR